MQTGETDEHASKRQKVITFKETDYILYEGYIIDEKEADRIYTQYHEILSQKQGSAAGSACVSDTESVQNNESSQASNLSGNAGQPTELAQSSA